MYRHGRWLMLPAALLAAGVGLAGCNTVEGIGKDISALGDGIDRSATRHRGEDEQAQRAEIEELDERG